MLDFRFQSFEFAHVGTINASGGKIVNKRGEGRVDVVVQVCLYRRRQYHDNRGGHDNIQFMFLSTVNLTNVTQLTLLLARV